MNYWLILIGATAVYFIGFLFAALQGIQITPEYQNTASVAFFSALAVLAAVGTISILRNDTKD